jgi:hypothetical protein
MRKKRSPAKPGKPTRTRRRNNRSEVSDLEVARKMLKIHQSAQDRSLEFDLSFLTVKSLLLEKKCYYTEKEFEDSGNFARSFDRIDSNKGYVEGNVVACTVDINAKKSNLSFEEIELLYNKLSDYQTELEEPVSQEGDHTPGGTGETNSDIADNI